MALNPKFAPGLYQRAARFADEGQAKEAMADLRNAVSIDPGYTEAHRLYGNLALADGDVKTAEEQYRAVLNLDSKNLEALNGLGVACLRQGMTSQASVYFTQALQLDPGFQPAEENLKIVRASEGRFSSSRP